VQQQIWGVVVDFNLAFFRFIWECNRENIIKLVHIYQSYCKKNLAQVFGPPCRSNQYMHVICRSTLNFQNVVQHMEGEMEEGTGKEGKGSTAASTVTPPKAKSLAISHIDDTSWPCCYCACTRDISWFDTAGHNGDDRCDDVAATGKLS